MERKLKQFVVKKYVMALTAAHAIKAESKFEVSEIWVDEEWAKNNQSVTNSTIGFKKPNEKQT